MKEHKEALGYGLRHQSLHPRPIHDPVTGTEFIGFIGPLWFERMLGSEIEPGQLFGVDEDGPGRLNVFLSQGSILILESGSTQFGI
jgi:hypothetical protein